MVMASRGAGVRHRVFCRRSERTHLAICVGVSKRKEGFAVEQETLERDSLRGDVGQGWEQTDADGVVDERARGDYDRKGEGFAVKREKPPSTTHRAVMADEIRN